MKKKITKSVSVPQFRETIDAMPLDSKLFVDKSLEIVHYIFRIMDGKKMNQKELATKLGKSEAEVSKILSGLHNLTLRSIAKLEVALEETIICTPKNQLYVFPKNLPTHTSFVGKKTKNDNILKPNLVYEAKVVAMHSKQNKMVALG